MEIANRDLGPQRCEGVCSFISSVNERTDRIAPFKELTDSLPPLCPPAAVTRMGLLSIITSLFELHQVYGSSTMLPPTRPLVFLAYAALLHPTPYLLEWAAWRFNPMGPHSDQQPREIYAIRRLTWTAPRMTVKGVRSCRARHLPPRRTLRGIGTRLRRKRRIIAFLSPMAVGGYSTEASILNVLRPRVSLDT